MKTSDILERAEDWNQRGDCLRLRPAEWLLLASVDGSSTVGDLMRDSQVDEPFVMTSLRKFIQLDLVRRAELSWEEFCRRCPGLQPVAAVARTVPVTPSPEAPVGNLPAEAPTTLPTPPPELPASAPVRFRLSAATRQASGPAQVPPAPEFALPTSPLPRPPVSPVLAAASVPLSSQPASPSNALSLRSVLDFVMGHAGGGNRGQLAVYRTFLKIPASQLRESGIKSLDLATSEVQITDPALQVSILNAVQAVTGQVYPAAFAR